MLRLRLFLALIIAGSLTLPLQAATITVADDGADYTSIQAAVDAAVSGQDEVVVSPGTYLEAINFNGKAITLRSASGDPADTIIDGTGNYHVVQCINGEGAGTVLEGFTITGGNANGNFPDNVGGGMYNLISSPTVSNCTFSGNTAYAGGGMYNYNSSPTVTNCILWGDSPDEIYTTSSSTLTVSFSDVQGGLPANTVDGGGNIDADPLFVDADGPDNTAGTEDDDLRLSGGSPCIDAADTTALRVGVFTDLYGNLRGVDDPATADTGVSVFGVVVDMGAYEFQTGPCISQLEGDINCDGIVNLLDLSLLALHWLETI